MLIFSDITASSWRHGEALIRHFLGPAKHVGQLHSPPTRDISKNDSSADGQRLTSVDIESSRAITDAPSQTHGSDIVRDGLDHSTVELEPTLSASSFDGHSTGEVVDTKDNASASSDEHQQFAAATNASDLEIQQTAGNQFAVKLPGNILVYSYYEILRCSHKKQNNSISIK